VLGTMCCFVFMQHNRLITRTSCFRYVLCPVDLYEYECWYSACRYWRNILGQQRCEYNYFFKSANHIFGILRLNPNSQICKFLRCASPQIKNPQFFLFFRKFQNQKFSRCVKEDKEDKTHILKNVWHLFGLFMTKPPKIRPQVCSD
jgi:hypothetical protein